MSRAIWRRYGAYLERPPEQVFEWHDTETDAVGWLVLNSLRGGAAGGGTRMRPGVTREEVVYLAKAMELKFSFAGPRIGGGKSGIRFDPGDPRKRDVLRRWYAAVRPFLATRYGTGGDVNVDEQREVVPLCGEIGLAHPQEGIVRGHLGVHGDAVEATFRSLRQGLCAGVTGDFGVPGARLTVSDLITGFGVARAAQRLYGNRGESLEGVRVVVEGFGNVGAAACLYLSRMGARIVGIVDRDHALIVPDGLHRDDVEDLLRRRTGTDIPDHPLRVEGPERENAYRANGDLFVPAAVSGSVDARRVGQLARHGFRRMVCGANQPFREVHLGETHVARAADETFEVMPAIVASLGMARTFYHLMTHPGGAAPEEIFAAVGEVMDEAVDRVMDHADTGSHGLIAAAVDLAMQGA